MPKTKDRRSSYLTTAVVSGLAMAMLVILVHQKVMGYDQEGCLAPRWTTLDQDGDRLTLRQRSGRCKLEVTLRGELRWNATEDGIAWIEPDGRLEVAHRTAEHRHLLKARGSSDGTPQVEYRLDGDVAEVDEAARAWLHEVAMILFRRVGLDAEARSQRIFERAGVVGLVEEMDAIGSDSIAARYARAAFAGSPEALAAVLRAAARQIKSDHSSAELLVDLARSGLPAERSPELVHAVCDVLATVRSDYALRRSVLALLAAPTQDPEFTEALLETAAKGIDSDYEAAELVIAVASRLEPGDPLPAGLLDLLRTVESNYELRRSLLVVVAGARIPSDLLDLVEVAREIDSDHDLAEVLIALSREANDQPETELAWRATLQQIRSDYERQRVESALQRRDNASPTESGP